MPYLIAIDSDGTLRHSDGSISTRTKKIIEKLVIKGNIVTICTARPRYHTLKISEEVGINGFLISSNGQSHHILRPERFGQNHHRPAPAGTLSAVRILHLGDQPRPPRPGARRGGLLLPLARGVHAGRDRKPLRGVGGGLQGNLLRHAALGGGAHLGQGPCDRLRRRRGRRHQPQAHLRRRRLLGVHHAALGRGAAPTARRPRHGRPGGDRPPRGQGRIRTDESPRVRPRGGQRLPRRGRVRHVQHPRPIHRTVG